jgi:adenosylmethionine-8-amino-7-oxononanoate aminotransferase
MELNQWSPGEIRKQVIKTDKYWIEYSDGQRRLDIQCGNAAYVLGYNDQDILNAIRSSEVNFLRGNSGESSALNDQLVELICKRGNWAGLGYAVSGSDAVEAAIAMNDKYWERLGINKKKIISFSQCYHGTTMLAKHLNGEYGYLDRATIIPAPLWRYHSDQEKVEAISLAQVRAALESDKEIGGLIMETVPWVGTLRPYSKNWWETIRALCNEFKVLMIVDDVAICWGKNGSLFGWESYGVQPDISALGKSLTGGYSPLGVAVCGKRVQTVLSKNSWEHSHTWSPNMAGVSAALAVTNKIESLLHRVSYIEQQLDVIAKEFNLNSRGSGLLRSFDVNKEVSLSDLFQAGLVSAIKGNQSIKVVAPIIADDEYFETLRNSFKSLV